MSFDEFGELVAQHYAPLYKFAFSLTRAETDASDLTQQTFYLWATKGHQLREGSKAKTWLFTTLHRIFLQARRRQTRFPQRGLDEVAPEDLPAASPPPGDRLDSAQVLRALAQVDEVYQGAVALFYLEDCSYKEIAEILEVAEGTVKSRISRGITQLRHLLGCSGPTPCRPPANPGTPLEIFRKISQNFSPAGVTSPLVARAIQMASCVVIGEQAAAFIQSQNKGLDRRRLRSTSDVNLPVAGAEQSKELLNIAAGRKGTDLCTQLPESPARSEE